MCAQAAAVQLAAAQGSWDPCACTGKEAYPGEPGYCCDQGWRLCEGEHVALRSELLFGLVYATIEYQGSLQSTDTTHCCELTDNINLLALISPCPSGPGLYDPPDPTCGSRLSCRVRVQPRCAALTFRTPRATPRHARANGDLSGRSETHTYYTQQRPPQKLTPPRRRGAMLLKTIPIQSAYHASTKLRSSPVLKVHKPVAASSRRLVAAMATEHYANVTIGGGNAAGVSGEGEGSQQRVA
eukprot:1150131-Pelagomonas_calceolata.AAC.2